MGILQISGIALLGAMAILLLRELRATAAVPVRLVTTLVLVGAAVGLYAPILSRLHVLFSLSGGASLAGAVLRAVGIGLICELTAGFCRDLGEGSVAEGVVLFGKLEILLLALPLLDELLKVIGELLK
ncbi:MAG: hypothetical protein E7639_05625 [Ruminococcaceae bacterium]|nr:hypothetical protein [Oscillospiraceae bacterium]